ncbi:ABC transporter permease [Nocardioides campestrisoli]|uniref:ABC transporter permease n=1 Tax=Nocardioides campestrisoli TaxID=2736757 RepID=UPI00163DD445|nr:SMP-30/gluconolactonase/LRE family protein [Nocardioides campestrisoli]
MTVDAYGLSGRSPVHRFSAQRMLADLMEKRWMDAIAPVALLVAVVIYFALTVPELYNAANTVTTTQILAEMGLLALAMTVVVLGGGIDLSVGSIFAVSNAVAVICFKLYELPVLAVFVIAIGVGALCGSINGAIISIFKTRPFITTLVTLLTFRTVAIYLDQEYSPRVSVLFREDVVWTFLARGSIAGLPVGFWVMLLMVVLFQFVITRTRFGWQVTALGASRTSARRAGMRLNRLSFTTYVISGSLAGLSGVLVAARLGQTSQTTGQGYELIALTAIIIGGVSLGGGKGTAARALLGALVTSGLYQGMLLMGYDNNLYQVVLAVVLLAFATLDIKYAKNRDKAIQKIFVVPGEVRLPALANIYEPGSVWNPNRRLTDAQPIGLGQLDGPEDVIVDRNGHLYCGDRRGYIWRFEGPDYTEGKIFCRVGGLPLGLAIDKDDNLVVCVGGMGLYAIDPQGQATALTTRTKRSWHRIRDDSAVRLADDLDIAPDGKIYFSDASTRFDGVEHMYETMEARPNGRVLCYDPETGETTTVVKNYAFPNGICVSHDGQSVLINSSVLARIDRLWIDGPKKGQLEPFLEDLPGYPDNTNRASDGTYWVAFASMRTPTFDLAVEDAGFRRRMLKELPLDEWIIHNMNTSCVFKVTEEGEVLESLWDETLEHHSLITSMREHDGHLFLGGLTNNRVGRVALPKREGATSSTSTRATAGLTTSGGVSHA